MFKKILIGLVAFAIACSLAHSGYTLGKYLAAKDKAAKPAVEHTTTA